MENASKAIIIAGGILISMIVISLFFFMFSNMSTLVDTTSKDTTEVQIVDFNKGFEAYNKKIMYGADIISVVNKAIDNNAKYKATKDNENNEYYIDVAINFKERLELRTETYKQRTDMNGKYRLDSSKTHIQTVLQAGATIKLSEEQTKIEDMLIKPVQLSDIDGNPVDNKNSSVSTYSPGCASYTVTYYPASEFKRKIFYCSDVKYSKTSGRVIEMSFTQK